MTSNTEKCPVCGREQEKGFTYCQDRRCSSPMSQEYYIEKAQNRKRLINESKLWAGIGNLLLPLYAVVYGVCYATGEVQFIDDMNTPLFLNISLSFIITIIAVLSIVYGSVLLIKNGKQIAYVTLFVLGFEIASPLWGSVKSLKAIEPIIIMAIFILPILNAILLFKLYKEHHIA